MENPMSNTNTIRVSSLASFLVLLLMTVTSYAQSGGSISRGTVKDPNGNVVAGASVTITNPEKNFTRTQSTNQDGGYVFTAVPPGTYKLDVTAPGFKTASASGLVALVDTPTVRDVQLEIGQVSETVDVTSTAEAAINTSDATIGNSFERKRIVELPLNANNVVGLLSFQPGGTRSGFVNGGRADQSNITLDGVDVNEQQDGLDVVTDEAFASVLRVTRDSLQEFRVTTTNPNAEQ